MLLLLLLLIAAKRVVALTRRCYFCRLFSRCCVTYISIASSQDVQDSCWFGLCV
jgi:hypothetical protein